MVSSLVHCKQVDAHFLDMARLSSVAGVAAASVTGACGDRPGCRAGGPSKNASSSADSGKGGSRINCLSHPSKHN